MPDSKFESIAKYLEQLLSEIDGPEVKRNDELPERIENDEGLLILQDGQEVDVETVLGGFDNAYHRHEFELEGFVQSGSRAERNQRFDALWLSVDAKLQSDKTLGGLAAGMDYSRPETFTSREQGTAAVKGGVLSLFIEYETDTPLG